MKALGLLVCVLAASLTMVGVARADDAEDDAECRSVHAVGVGQDLGGGNTTATIRRGGVLNGTTSAHFDRTGFDPPVLAFAGTVTFTTKRGLLFTSIAGTFNLETGAFTGTGPITRGTGKLTGATGTLTFNGVRVGERPLESMVP